MRPKLWIIDDTEAIRELFERHCSDEGFDVQTFMAAEHALSMIEAGEKPDAVTCSANAGIGAANFYGSTSFILEETAKYVFTGGIEMPEGLKSRNDITLIKKPVSPMGFLRHIQNGVGLPVPKVWTVTSYNKVPAEIRNEGYDLTEHKKFTDVCAALRTESPDAVVADYRDMDGSNVVGLYVLSEMEGLPRIIIGAPDKMEPSTLEKELQKNPATKGVKVINWRDAGNVKEILNANFHGYNPMDDAAD